MITDPVVRDELNHNSGIEYIDAERVIELCAEVSREIEIVKDAVQEALDAEGVLDNLAIAFSAENHAAHQAGIAMFLGAIQKKVQDNVMTEAMRRYDREAHSREMDAAEAYVEARQHD